MKRILLLILTFVLLSQFNSYSIHLDELDENFEVLDISENNPSEEWLKKNIKNIESTKELLVKLTYTPMSLWPSYINSSVITYILKKNRDEGNSKSWAKDIATLAKMKKEALAPIEEFVRDFEGE